MSWHWYTAAKSDNNILAAVSAAAATRMPGGTAEIIRMDGWLGFNGILSTQVAAIS